MNLCIVNEDPPQCHVPRKAIKACPGRGPGSWALSPSLALRERPCRPFSPQDFCSPCELVHCCPNTRIPWARAASHVFLFLLFDNFLKINFLKWEVPVSKGIHTLELLVQIAKLFSGRDRKGDNGRECMRCLPVCACMYKDTLRPKASHPSLGVAVSGGSFALYCVFRARHTVRLNNGMTWLTSRLTFCSSRFAAEFVVTLQRIENCFIRNEYVLHHSAFVALAFDLKSKQKQKSKAE